MKLRVRVPEHADGRRFDNPKANYTNALRAKTPEVASPHIRRIYRALLTRPMKGARVFCVDAETRAYLRSRIQRG